MALFGRTTEKGDVLSSLTTMTLQEVERANPHLPVANWWREPISHHEAGCVVMLESAWVPLTYSGTWGDLGGTYNVGEYRIEGDIVRIRGLIKPNGVVTTGSTIAELPPEARPPLSIITTGTSYTPTLTPDNEMNQIRVYWHGSLDFFQDTGGGGLTASSWVTLNLAYSISS